MCAAPQQLKALSHRVSSASNWRLPLNGPAGQEVSHVLGSGVVPGALILLGGDPGIGKSTLLLQLAGLLSATGPQIDAQEQTAPHQAALYVTGEESAEQVDTF